MFTNKILAPLLLLHCGIALACFDSDPSIPVSDLLPRAERGDASAQFVLAEEYHRGEYNCGRGEIAGVPQDFKEARRWYTMAANQGNADAAFALATMYINGEGVEPDQRAARNWLQRAADGGNLPARTLIQNGLF
jgi:TPR repeat protein